MDKFNVFDPVTQTVKPYVELALRTAKPLEPRMNLMHAVSGLACEILEVFNCYGGSYCNVANGKYGNKFSKFDIFLAETYSRMDLIKEMGDVCWFLALYYSWRYADEADAALHEDVMEFQDLKGFTDNNTALFELPKMSEQLGGMLKAEVFYGNPADVNAIHNIAKSILQTMLMICHKEDIPFMDVLTGNVAKLAKRYKGEGYTQEAAAAKIDNQEQAA